MKKNINPCCINQTNVFLLQTYTGQANIVQATYTMLLKDDEKNHIPRLYKQTNVFSLINVYEVN